ncbi:GntR family transcriptional regulator [Bacillus methanolicus]|uniref:aminotransferase-like domain-containing protein n=1 Tax=Bacillus methanolicus TaxID=1471 RepID=UPI0023800A14|nr:PLP-dependent aminotransferase family protein [Bacillus methanolicus]MDE3840884.1 GntR family transcriptional regulator [Bacillus methanolicus]
MENLGWKPNRLSTIPLHKQIEEYLKEKILNGEWTVGTKIPSQRALAKAFEVNRSTIVTALNELTAQGLLEGKSGGGTRVVNNTWSLLTSTTPPDWNAYVKAGIHEPNLPTIQEINKAEFYPDIIRLGTGELSPELLPYEQMQRIFPRIFDRKMSLGYEESKGDFFLRSQLTNHLKRLGINTSPSSILIVSGALQALQLISIGLLKRGSTVLLEKPSYLYSVNVFQSAGMKLVGVPMDEHGIRTSLIERYKKQYNGSLLYLIPSFHNPTGTLMTEERRKHIMKICEQLSLPLIEDDVYGELWIDEPPPSPLKAKDKHGHVLYLGSLSKTLSPGLRIGWIVGPEPVIERLADIKMQTDYGSSSLSQKAAAEWLASDLYQKHLEFVREQLKIRRAAAMEALETHLSDIATWNFPKGGFFIWLKIKPKLSMRNLYEIALSKGILLNTGNIYSQEPNQYLRLSYAYASLPELKQGIYQLSQIIRSLGTDS